MERSKKRHSDLTRKVSKQFVEHLSKKTGVEVTQVTAVLDALGLQAVLSNIEDLNPKLLSRISAEDMKLGFRIGGGSVSV